MKSYVHDPSLFQRHFAGKALPAFKGKQIQRGRGAAFSFIKRLAIPLLQAVAPHIAGAASSLARKAVTKVFPKHKKMQKVVGDVVRVGAGAAVNQVQKTKRKTSSHLVGPGSGAVKRRKKRNIFNE